MVARPSRAILPPSVPEFYPLLIPDMAAKIVEPTIVETQAGRPPLEQAYPTAPRPATATVASMCYSANTTLGTRTLEYTMDDCFIL